MLAKKIKMLAAAIGVLGASMFLGSINAYAVPSFARQTGLSCAACHTVFPQLTTFGRLFKLGGYTLTNVNQVQDRTFDRRTRLVLNEIPPLSAMAQISYTSVRKATGKQNNQLLLPKQFSFFYAGRITPKIGAFAQVTVDKSGTFGMDNTDFRYADHVDTGGGKFLYGVTINNNPTVQDVWNTAPAWQELPNAALRPNPSEAFNTQIESLGQMVGGLGAYGAYQFGDGHNLFYGELTGYRSMQFGSVPASKGTSNVIENLAPYWRLAFEHDWGRSSWEVGALGMSDTVNPTYGGSDNPGPTDHFTDYGLDSQYEYVSSGNIFTTHARWIHEKRNWNATFANGGTSNPNDTLNTYLLDGTYWYHRHYGASAEYFAVNGSSDAAYYGPTGSPNSKGEILELNYAPWLNSKFALQYTFYNQFNGAGSNYNGAGRNASDNNTLFALAWFVF